MLHLCPHADAHEHPPLQPQTVISFDCVILGTCGVVEEAVSCSCLEGSTQRARQINHAGVGKSGTGA